jgi:outer membrane protein
MRLTLLTFLLGVGLTLQAQDKKIMTLQECVDVALQNNINVQRGKLGLEVSETNLNQARMQRLPTLNADGRYGLNWGRSIDPTTNQFITREIAGSNASLISSVPLFAGRQIHNSIQQNEINVQASMYDVEKASNDVTINVVLFYLNVIFNKELYDNARVQLESSQQQLERTKLMVAAGRLPKASELELQSQVSSNEVNLINAENNLNLAILNLKQAMMLPAGENIDILIPGVEVEDLDISKSSDQVFSNAERTMPEIKAADSRIRSAELDYKVSQGGLTPRISLTGGLSTVYSNANRLFDLENPINQRIPIGYLLSDPNDLSSNPGESVYRDLQTYNTEDYPFLQQYKDNLSKFVSLNISIPIFNGYQTRYNMQRSKIGIQQAELNAMEQRNFLRQTIESAYNDAQAASKTYAASVKQVEALQETFRAIETQFNVGAANFTDYQVAANNLFRAMSDLTRAKYEYVFRKKLLDFYQGNPLDIN